MKNLPHLLCLSLLTISLSAQPTIEWQKTLGGSGLEEIYSTQQTTDNGYIAAGFTYSNNGDVTGFHGGIDAWVVKFSSTGSIEWKKTYGGTDVDWAYEIQQTFDGGYILAGYTASNNGDVSGNHGGKDAWVVKLNGSGGIQWQKSLGGSGWDEAWAIRQTTDGGYIMAGRSASQNGDVTGNHGSLDYWIVKLSSIGGIEWQKSLGGTGEDNAYAVKQTSDGGYIVAGESLSQNGDITGNHGDADYWVVKLSATGSLEWQKSFGGSSLDRSNDIVQADDGGYVVVGQASSNNGDITQHYLGYDIWVVKMDPSGEIQWQKSLGGSDQDWGSAIQKTSDGGYVIAGSAWSTDGDLQNCNCIVDIWVVKVSSEGILQWQKSLGGSMGEDGNAIYQTSDGGYVVAGMAWSDDGDVTGHQAKSDFWIVKLSPASVGLDEIPDAFGGRLEIYPNPAHQSISLKTSSAETSLSVSIRDLLGREISRQNIQSGEPVDLAHIPSGLYLVLATTTSGRAFSGKLRKE